MRHRNERFDRLIPEHNYWLTTGVRSPRLERLIICDNDGGVEASRTTIGQNRCERDKGSVDAPFNNCRDDTTGMSVDDLGNVCVWVLVDWNKTADAARTGNKTTPLCRWGAFQSNGRNSKAGGKSASKTRLRIKELNNVELTSEISSDYAREQFPSMVSLRDQSNFVLRSY